MSQNPESGPQNEIGIKEITWDEVPSDVQALLEREVEVDYEAKLILNDHQVVKISEPPVDTFGLVSILELSQTKNGKVLYVVQKTGDEIIGYGSVIQVKYNDPPLAKDRPYVLFTTTYQKFLNQGYAIRRLLTLNALSMKYWKLPIHSSFDIQSVAAIKAWKSPKLKGLVQHIRVEGGRKVYYFYQFKVPSSE